MSDTIHAWIGAIGAHPLLVLAIVFMAACAEAIALIGTVVPAGAVMFAAGALIGAGALDSLDDHRCRGGRRRDRRRDQL